MQFQKGNPGRPRGAKNKVGQAAKEVIAKAADELGGVDRLVAWAREAPENERYFWANIFPKLLPHEIGGDSGELVVRVVRFDC